MVSLRKLNVLFLLEMNGKMRVRDLRRELENGIYKECWEEDNGDVFWFRYDLSDYLKRMWKKGLLKRRRVDVRKIYKCKGVVLKKKLMEWCGECWYSLSRKGWEMIEENSGLLSVKNCRIDLLKRRIRMWKKRIKRWKEREKEEKSEEWKKDLEEWKKDGEEKLKSLEDELYKVVNEVVVIGDDNMEKVKVCYMDSDGKIWVEELKREEVELLIE
jgi:hypothetical protein